MCTHRGSGLADPRVETCRFSVGNLRFRTARRVRIVSKGLTIRDKWSAGGSHIDRTAALSEVPVLVRPQGIQTLLIPRVLGSSPSGPTRDFVLPD